MNPTQFSRLIEDHQFDLRRAAAPRRRPRRDTELRLVHPSTIPAHRTVGPVRGVGLLLVRIGQRLAGTEETGGRRATTS